MVMDSCFPDAKSSLTISLIKSRLILSSTDLGPMCAIFAVFHHIYYAYSMIWLKVALSLSM